MTMRREDGFIGDPTVLNTDVMKVAEGKMD